MIKKNYLGFVIILITFILDRVSKILIINHSNTFGKLDMSLNPFLNLNLIWNDGIAFGLFSFDEKNYYNLLTFLIIGIILVLLWLMFRSSGLEKLGFASVIGGSLGNVTDRIFYSSVPDFIDLNYNGFHWFVFNIADIFITIGVLLLIVLEFLKKK
ncbi:signal peptidase II [Candidatus Pelagibacter sp.]|nr:signal peptidase II [Candidatus Pelagibacter sp.]